MRVENVAVRESRTVGELIKALEAPPTEVPMAMGTILSTPRVEPRSHRVGATLSKFAPQKASLAQETLLPSESDAAA